MVLCSISNHDSASVDLIAGAKEFDLGIQQEILNCREILSWEPAIFTANAAKLLDDSREFHILRANV